LRSKRARKGQLRSQEIFVSKKRLSCEIENYKSWMFGLNSSKPQLLHIMIVIKDIEAALRFYIDGLDMKLLGQFDVEERRVTALFVGFEVGATALELAHYWDSAGTDTHGSGYRYVAIGVPDIDVAMAKLEAMGVEISMRPTILVAGMPRAAFVKDPDGYAVELFQTRNA
jgi:lactoylglutathione lyase